MEPASNPFTLSFRDPTLERELRADLARGAERHYRFVGWLGLVLYLSPGIFDLLEMGPGDHRRILIRFAVAGPLIAACVCFGFAPQRLFERWWQAVMSFAVTVLMVSVVMMTFLTPNDIASFGMLGIALVILGTHTLLQLRHVYAASACLVSTAIYGAVGASVVLPESARMVYVSIFYLVIANVLGFFGSRSLEQYRRRDFLQRREIEFQRARSERLLRNVLPEAIAERLKGDERIADRFEEVTVLFGDLVGFTPLAETLAPETMVAALDAIFSDFDDLAERLGLEKIKTIGDAYMVVGGLPTARADHAEAIAEMALAMRASLARHPLPDGRTLRMRIGVHSGPAVAGVIGKRKFIYDLWGDTVNIASRMESHGVEDGIQVTEATWMRLRDKFALEPRGKVSVKGKGEMETWLLVGRRAEAAATE